MSTLHVSEKTNQGVLPQFLALESTPADKPGVGTKWGVETRSEDRVAGVQHGRWETGNGVTNLSLRHPVGPASAIPDDGVKSTGVAVTTAAPAGTVGLVSFEIQHRRRLICKKLEQRSNYPPVGGAGTSGTGRPGSTIGPGQRAGWPRASGTGWTRPCRSSPGSASGHREAVSPKSWRVGHGEYGKPRDHGCRVPPGYPGWVRGS